MMGERLLMIITVKVFDVNHKEFQPFGNNRYLLN